MRFEIGKLESEKLRKAEGEPVTPTADKKPD